MRPINNVKNGTALSDHKDAKPQLVAAMGEYCGYCERAQEARDLDVEHIKPQVSHPRLALTWGNFLLACSTCNTYKRHYQNADRQTGALGHQAWPHLDNTFLAFDYDRFGRVRVAQGLINPIHIRMAEETLNMTGLVRTPAVSETYKELGLDYDAISRRETAWRKAGTLLAAYLQNPTDIQAQAIANHAEDTGFFSIWMHVFAAHPVVRRRLIGVFKAAATCFDLNGNPLNPRAPGRI